MIRLELYIPKNFASMGEVSEVLSLLDKVKTELGFPYRNVQLEEEKWEKIKMRGLLPMGEKQKIDFPQIGARKQPQIFLLVFIGEDVATFYPQAGREKGVTIKVLDFLSGLLNREIKAINEEAKRKLEEELGRIGG
jgi:hypothetical protein